MRAWGRLFGLALSVACTHLTSVGEASAAELVPIIGHEETTVLSMAPNGMVFISGGSDDALKVWETRTGRLLRTLTGHRPLTLRVGQKARRGIGALAISGDARRLASAGSDNTIRLWDIETGAALKVMETSALPIRALAWSSDGEYIVSGGEHRSIDGVEMERAEIARRPQTLRQMKAETGETVHDFAGHTGRITWVGMTSDGEFVVSADRTRDGRSLRVWRRSDGRLLHELAGSAGLPTNDASIDPTAEGPFIDSTNATVRAVIIEEGRVAVQTWSLRTGQKTEASVLWPLEGSNARDVAIVSTQLDHMLVKVGSHADTRVALWSRLATRSWYRQAGLAGDEQVARFDTWGTGVRAIDYATAAAISEDAASLVVYSKTGETILYRATEPPLSLPAPRLPEYIRYADHDSTRFVTVDTAAILWNFDRLAGGGAPVIENLPHDGCILNDGQISHQRIDARARLEFLPVFRSNLIAVSELLQKEGHLFCVLRLLRPDDGALVMNLNDELLLAVDRSLPPRTIATLDVPRHRVVVRDLGSLSQVKTYDLGAVSPDDSSIVSSIVLSPAKRWLARASSTGIEVTDTASKKRRRISGPVDGFDVSPDEKHMAVSHARRLIIRRLSDLGTALDHPIPDDSTRFRPELRPFQRIMGAPRYLDENTVRLRSARSFAVVDLRSKRIERVAHDIGDGRAIAVSLGNGLVLLASRFDSASVAKARVHDTTAPGLKMLYSFETDHYEGVRRSFDGALVAIPAGNTVKLVDARTGQLVRELAGHIGPVITTEFAPDNMRLLSGSADGTYRLWRIADGRPLLTLIGSGDGQWQMQTPEGFFAASSTSIAGRQSIVAGLSSYGIDQVWQSLYNPDLVRAKLDGDDAQIAKAASVLALDKVLASGPAPTVEIMAPSPTGRTTREVVSVEARVTGRESKGVGRIEWRVNGVTAGVLARPYGPGPAYTVSRDLALKPGENRIEVVAYNEANLLASPVAAATIAYDASRATAMPHLHVLAIGIDGYTDMRFGKLAFAGSDADAFAGMMRRVGSDTSRYAGDPVVVRLPESEATRDGIARAIDAMTAPGRMHQRDIFILFAAGHGTSENGRFYLIPHGFRSGPGALEANAIRQEDLQEWLANKVTAQRALLLLDTCASGALVSGAERPRVTQTVSEAAIGRLHEATGRPVLTAAATGRAAAEGHRAADGRCYGVFTYAVLDAFRAGDRDDSGAIDLVELVAHVQKRVPELAAALDCRADDRGAAVRPPLPVTTSVVAPAFRQAARFGSRGDNFIIGRKVE
jgi:WD40 repeat protein